MKRSLYGHTIFAVITAIAAYIAWTQPKQTAPNSKVTVVPGSLDRVTRVEFTEERWNIAVARTGDDSFDVTVQRIPQKHEHKVDDAKKPDEATEEGEAAAHEHAHNEEPARADPPAKYPGTGKVAEMLEKLAPLEVARSFGSLEPKQLERMGLDHPKSKLTLVFGGKQHVIDIGDSTYGSGDLYARTDAGEVFLMPSNTIASIRHGASSLLDKNAVGVPREKVTRLTITAGASGREIAQRYSEDQDKRFFSDPAEPEAKLEMVSNWLEQFWSLRVSKLLTDASEAPPAVVPPAVEVELFAGPESLGVVRLWPPDDRVSRATSTRFEHPFTVSKATAESLLKDLDGVLTEGR